MQRLSRPADQMHGHYSAVVIGSGYGGAIVASRIARTGRDVCVLERGRELHPGEYPNSALTGLREIQVHTPTADRGPATISGFDANVSVRPSDAKGDQNTRTRAREHDGSHQCRWRPGHHLRLRPYRR